MKKWIDCAEEKEKVYFPPQNSLKTTLCYKQDYLRASCVRKLLNVILKCNVMFILLIHRDIEQSFQRVK